MLVHLHPYELSEEIPENSHLTGFFFEENSEKEYWEGSPHEILENFGRSSRVASRRIIKRTFRGSCVKDLRRPDGIISGNLPKEFLQEISNEFSEVFCERISIGRFENISVDIL